MRETGRVVLEALIVAVVGTGFGLAANETANLKSKSGLKLFRDYFLDLPDQHPREVPGGDKHSSTTTQSVTTTQAGSDSAGPGNGTNQTEKNPEMKDPELEKAKKLVKDKGFTPAEYDAVLRMYNAPGYQSAAYVIIDARPEDEYKAGHIPQAWNLDHYHLDKTIDAVLPWVQSAEKVILYCHGGNCEDSLFAAGDLRYSHNIEASKLEVYVGGFESWVKHKQPVEKGERGSGDITTGGAQ
jgi:rhodanese-related sulfurtransferase